MMLSVCHITKPRKVPAILATVVIMMAACQSYGATKSTFANHSADSLLSPIYSSFVIKSCQKAADGTDLPSNCRSFVLAELRDDIMYLLKQPDFYLVVGGLTIAPSAFENESLDLNRKWVNSQSADWFFEFGDAMGSALVPLVVSFGSYSLGKIEHSPEAESFGSDLLRTEAINGLLTVAFKAGINRKRPDGTRYSYPSGHTSTAFTSAGVIYTHFGPVWGLPAYVIASYVGLSRLQENKHYLTDVIGGAILGGYVAYKVTHKRRKASSPSISPFVTGKTFGARLAISF